MPNTNSMTEKGKFISFEGIDGAGKSSNINALADFLTAKGKQVYLSREPGGTVLGERIRDIVLQGHADGIVDDAELLLMFAARVQHVEEIIKPKLNQGIWVLSDRFVDASFAYQGAGRGIDMARMCQLSEWSINQFYPDLTVIFNLSVELSIERMAVRNHDNSLQDKAKNSQVLDRFEQQENDFKHRVNDYYRSLTSTEVRQFCHLDASQSLPNVTQQLLSDVTQRWFND